jgi:hypothetical protein
LVEPEALSFALTFYVAVCFTAIVYFWSRESFRFHRCDFFYLYITIGFRLLDTYKACGELRGCSPLAEKYKPTDGRSGDFSVKRQKAKEYPRHHTFPNGKQVENRC